MVVVQPHGCGISMSQQTVVACLRCLAAGSPPRKEVRPFGTMGTIGTIGTMTADLLRLVDWLGAGGGTHVAMERTGVDGKPLCKRLEDRRAVLVVYAHHGKSVPGRKTDVRDGEWSTDLLRHEWLRPRCIPGRFQREVRALTHSRTTLVRTRAAAGTPRQTVRAGTRSKLAGGSGQG